MRLDDAVIQLKLPDGTPAELRLRGSRHHLYKEESATAGGAPQNRIHLEHAETWLEYPLRDGFMAALRILPDEGGQLVVGEVRVFAREPEGYRYDAGRWEPRIGSANQPTAIGLPPRGVPSRVLREVRIPASLHAVRGLMREFKEGWRKLGVDPFDRRELFGAKGFTEEATEEPPPRQGPGRPPLDERYLAQVADKYVRLVVPGRKTVADLAATLHIAESTLRDQLGKARDAGLLTQAPRGRSGGGLTPKARELIAPKKRSKGGKA